MGITLRNLFASVILLAVCATAITEPILERDVRATTTQNVIVSFKGQIESVIDKINKQTFKTVLAKRTALTKAQIDFSSNDQAEVQKYLKTKVVDFDTIWINNKMVVYKADEALIKEIKKYKTVVSVDKDNIHILNGNENGNRSSRATALPQREWGVVKIRANDVWSHYTGKGVVVAGIDSGVLYTHEALKANWRQDYGWYDPHNRTLTPNDQTGHGTHTMGTLAGANGIGVAPGVTWIACKGCYQSTLNPAQTACPESALMMCGMWAQCPFPPNLNVFQVDCTKSPQIVSNSWGGSIGGDAFYDTIIKSWNAAGIIPVFAIGNAGEKGCGTVRSPGDRPGTIGVGGITEQNRISPSSSLGPTVPVDLNFIKPDVVAPGVDILSAWHTGDHQYMSQTGTSIACPHVSGVIALMLQKNPGLTNDQIYNAIIHHGVDVDQIDPSTAPTCGFKSPTTGPNFVFGYGRIDAVKSLNAV